MISSNVLKEHAERERLLPFPMSDLQKVEETRERLIQKLKYKPSLEINFHMSSNNAICCFEGKRLFITDEGLRPILTYESSSYLHACTISRTAKYVLCQMAHNKENDADSGAMALFDIKSKQLISRGRLPTGWKGMTHLFVDEQEKRIFVYYGDDKKEYDFQLMQK